MFNKQNFCHIASNNRNEQKAGIFVYKTTDDLQTVLQSGYFNEKIIDINLHDLIIHEQTNATDKTIVERNLLCVVERTLENVGTTVIKSKWEENVGQDIEQIMEDLAGKVNKSGDTMTGPLKLSAGNSTIVIEKTALGAALEIYKESDPELCGLLIELVSRDRIDICSFAGRSNITLGSNLAKIKKIHTITLNNGGDLTVPENTTGTIATKAQVDLAANSGRMITDQGVWYAKMYTATTPEAAEDGTNYADFSQVDQDNNPIIVIYERQNGAWVLSETITPPAEYDGYIPITSKMWDITEQDGQQGGRVLWNHQSKEFTPYPVIISFEDAHLTGDSTVVMPATPSGSSIVNVDYLTTHTGSGKNVGDVFFTMRNDNALSGAVECNGATYNTENFVGSGTISGLLAAGKIPYVSLAQYETLLSTQGSVGVFGWDGGNTTVFRVPSLNDIFIETGTAAQIGDYLTPGVPNLKGYLSVNSDYSDVDGVLIQKTYLSNNSHGHDGSVTYNNKFDIDCSRKSSVYRDDVSTVQPNAVRYRAMVQLATGATDEALETCTQVLADVATLKSHEVIEFQAPTAANNYTWYRKYADGWVEQGGICSIDYAPGVYSDTTVNLPVTMADNKYTIGITADDRAYIYNTEVCYYSPSITTASFMIKTYQYGGTGTSGSEARWQVSGMAA